jgi:hypothetical protein
LITSVEFLVEEQSCERLLRQIVPDLMPGVAFAVFTFNGKPDLLKKLPDRLKGYHALVREYGYKIVVIVDRDDEDCRSLKEKLNAAARAAGLVPASDAPPGQPFDVLNRIAVEELEAWLLGDVPALRAAYPKIPASLGAREKFRDPDAVRGGTAEALERELQRHGYHGAGLSKVGNAEEVARHMDLDNNTSMSFRQFRDGVRRMVATEESPRAS